MIAVVHLADWKLVVIVVLALVAGAMLGAIYVGAAAVANKYTDEPGPPPPYTPGSERIAQPPMVAPIPSWPDETGTPAYRTQNPWPTFDPRHYEWERQQGLR